MVNRIIKRRWHWPTLLGQLEITADDSDGAGVKLDGRPISRHSSATEAANAAKQHQTGHQEWDRQQLPTPPLEYWGEIIEVAF